MTEPGPESGLSGPTLARAALDAALARRAQRMRAKAIEGTAGDRAHKTRRRGGYTGPGPDSRDPQLLSSVLGSLMVSRGWQKPRAEAMVFGAWEQVVGVEISAHSQPIKLEQGELTIQAESTAWATQLRLLSGRILANITNEIGRGVVTRLHIHGPVVPSWSHGPRRVRGRGPRDTYG